MSAHESDGAGPMSRRRAMALMGAAMALAGASSCRRPVEKIVPYARAVEPVVPGQPLHYATAVALYGTAFGLLVESHGGRPTKIEGNPRHPESLGATTAHLQAMVLDLYDPDRSSGPRERGAERTWADASAMLKALGKSLAADKGQSLLIVTELHRSPTLAAALSDLGKTLPAATVVRYEPFDRDAARSGAALAFGRPLDGIEDFEKAQVVVVLDGDPFAQDLSPIRAARAWARGRDTVGLANRRMYAVESTFSLAGASADHRFRCPSSEIQWVLADIARALSETHRVPLDPEIVEALARLEPATFAGDPWRRRIAAMASDLAEHRGTSLVVVGRRQPAPVHALAYLVNHALGNVDATLRFVGLFDDGPEGADALIRAAVGIEKGAIKTVIALGGNPVFDAPAALGFESLWGKVPLSIHLGTHVDETGAKAVWHLNRAHALESWTDAVALDGTGAIGQPLIAPLWAGKTDAEVIRLLGGDERPAYQLVRELWKRRLAALDFDDQWRRGLHDGFLQPGVYPTEQVTPNPGAVARAWEKSVLPATAYEIAFTPDSHSYDGRFANNGWLQELPDPFTKQTWGNAAWISRRLATDLGVADGDRIEVSANGASIVIPALIVPGQADPTITLSLGQGRRVGGAIANGVGVDTYRLRARSELLLATGVSARRAGRRSPIARTQQHFRMEGRPLARFEAIAAFRANSRDAGPAPDPQDLWAAPPSAGRRWGMTVDLGKCIGCGACVLACQAENNIAIVGEDGVARARAMHWIRVDRYFEGPPDEPRALAQPVTCHHCESAPCESVCPVGATTHSPDGLNDMTYSRCIGSRYCANNCPYKVRRFNYFEYARGVSETRQMQFNPDVTVRSRGVMEKCTFCVQRINRATVEAKRAGGAPMADGTIVLACEQACPTRAITFGDLADPASRVATSAADSRAYRMLGELNTKPRLSYLKRLLNLDPGVT